MKTHLIFLLGLIIIGGCQNKSSQKTQLYSLVGLTNTPVASSNFHNPNSTWWGYNMSKMARKGQDVYYGVIEDDNGTQTATAQFNIYKMSGSLAPVKVVSVTTSRPGNILIGPDGTLHVFVFSPFNVLVNDSIGSLVHYAYAGAAVDDFTETTNEVIRAAPNATTETVNIRIGADINAAGDMIVAYGLNYSSTISARAFVTFTKTGGGAWIETARPQPREFYYPFVALSDSGNITIMPVQDDFVSGTPNFNRYYIIPLFQRHGLTWTDDMLLDLSNDPLAITDIKPHLVEQSELIKLSDGRLLAIYKDKRESATRFFYRTITATGVVSPAIEIEWASDQFAWVRAFEFNNEVYFIATSYNDAAIGKMSTGEMRRVDLPSLPINSYIYLSSGRGGHLSGEADLDIYAITGDSAEYPNPALGAGARIYRVAKANLAKLFN